MKRMSGKLYEGGGAEEKNADDMGNGSLDGFVDDSNLLVEVCWITSSFESDDTTSKRMNDILE